MTDHTVDTDFFSPVARQTFAHRQRVRLLNFLHRFDWAMTGLAFDVGSNVRPMLEVHEVRHRGHFGPPDRLFAVPMTLELLHFGFIGCRDLVAANASLNRWDSRDSRAPRIAVTILAGNFVFPRMHLVAESDGLAPILATAAARRENSCKQNDRSQPHAAKDDFGFHFSRQQDPLLRTR